MKRLEWVTRERSVGGRQAPSAADWLVALALVIVALLEAAAGSFQGPFAVAAGFQLAATLPVAFRRVAPLTAIAVSVAVSLAYAVAYGSSNGQGGSVANAATDFLLIYSVGRHADRRGLLAGAACGLLLIVGEYWFGGRSSSPTDWADTLVLCGAALGLGVALRVQVQRSISLAVAAERARSEQDAAARAAVLDERERIARELHDVVAHNVGLILLQAGGARSVLSTDPERTRTALRQVEETGRQTLAEMRHLVGILRLDEDADRQAPPSVESPPAVADAVGVRYAPSVLDWLTALVLVIVASIELVAGVFPGPVVVSAAFQVAATLPVAFRRVSPVRAIAVSAAVFLPYIGAYGTGNSVANVLTVLLLVYSVGRHADSRGLLAGSAFGLLLLAEELAGNGLLLDVGNWAYLLVVFGGALGLGAALRDEVQRSTVLAVAAERARSEQEAPARAAVREERARIARELHDVVADKVGLIVLQAGGARSVLGTDPARARKALEHVEETGRQTLAEMRHLVGLLRVDDGADRQPLPRLERLPALVDETRAAGVAVELNVEGSVVGLPPGLELAAYRLVQEALTNVRKHAPRSSVRARLRYEPDRLRIEVSDDGGPSGTAGDTVPNASGAGHGLIGMRERVQLYGGRMEAGPTSGGGFRVEAVLPLTLGVP